MSLVKYYSRFKLFKFYSSSTRELTSLRSQVDRLKTEKSHLEQELFETQQNYTLLQKECSRIEDTFKKTEEQLEKERLDNAHIVEELTREVCCYVMVHRNGGMDSEIGYFRIFL